MNNIFKKNELNKLGTNHLKEKKNDDPGNTLLSY